MKELLNLSKSYPKLWLWPILCIRDLVDGYQYTVAEVMRKYKKLFIPDYFKRSWNYGS